MITKKRKTTRTVQVMTWSVSLRDDDNVQFAAMSGTLDAAHPLGRTSLTVHNRAVYQEHEAEAKAAYDDFLREVGAAAAGFVGVTTQAEGDELSDTDDPMTEEEEE